SGRGHGLRVCDEQTEYPWPICQKAPSVALTRGWERHDLLADLGNNALAKASAHLSLRFCFACLTLCNSNSFSTGTGGNV
ncbi:MAG: hypothetical protein ACRC7J_17240, partial [Vibrio ordalii]|uniref:hypothetical protein n=1 Tax=Vibrio ordalii TaxID=28174 RepID=UPI003F356BDD